MTRVLVTGGAGFIGHHVCGDLVNAGYEVVCIDPAKFSPHAFERGLTVVNATIEDAVRADLTGYLLKEEGLVERPDWIVHLAAPVGTYGVVQQAGQVASRIMSSTAAVIALARRHDSRLINVSTSEVYGFDGYYHEDATCVVPARHSARLAYAVGKLAAEQDVHSAGIAARTIRPFNVCGPGQSADLGFVLPRWCRQVLADHPITLFGTGDLQRAPMHVGDFCGLIRRYLHPWTFKDAPDVVNAGNPDNATTMLRLAQHVHHIGVTLTGNAPGIRHVDGKSVFGGQWEEAAGASKLPVIDHARALGWEPKITLDRIIEDVYRSLM